jgi:hypothetical protein
MLYFQCDILFHCYLIKIQFHEFTVGIFYDTFKFIVYLDSVICNTLNLGLNSDYNVKGIGWSEIKLELSVAAYGPKTGIGHCQHGLSIPVVALATRGNRGNS